MLKEKITLKYINLNLKLFKQMKKQLLMTISFNMKKNLIKRKILHSENNKKFQTKNKRKIK